MKKSENREAVELELQRLDTLHGGLRPSVVVQEAAEKHSPLHGEFEWDNKKASHEYRLIQARQLIRVIVPFFKRPDGTEIVDRYVHVPSTLAEAQDAGTKEGIYQRMSVVVLDPDAYARALTNLVAKVENAKQAAEELKDAATALPDPDRERMARIAMAITALQTAGAAVQALH